MIVTSIGLLVVAAATAIDWRHILRLERRVDELEEVLSSLNCVESE